MRDVIKKNFLKFSQTVGMGYIAGKIGGNIFDVIKSLND
jgi:hypothetical protein